MDEAGNYNARQTDSWTEFDHSMMARALDLARRGIGLVSPSPLVGCVIVSKRGEIVGEGTYIHDRVNHAETIALAEAGERARGGAAYVSLEPHAHYGRTPPCTDALINAGIERVVAPIEDPNPKVSGSGFDCLRAAGLVVEVGLKSAEAAKLNEKYIHFMRTGRPFVHLKIACSLDGRIATRGGDSRWITGEEARAKAHQIRHEYDAILVGSGTVLADDPLLTDRSGLARRRPLARVLLDRSLRLAVTSKLATGASSAPVMVFSAEPASSPKVRELNSFGVEIVNVVSESGDLGFVLDELARREIQSVIVEGGAAIAGAFLDAGLVNKVTFFIAPMVIGGIGAPCAVGGRGSERIAEVLRLSDVEMTRLGSDFELTGYPGSA